MRVLIDIVHPAHVHFYRHLYRQLIGEGADIRVVARDKDVTLTLLDRYDIPHVSTGPARADAMLSAASELFHRVRLLRTAIRAFHPDIVLTRNPSGVIAARLCGVLGVFDTDDGRAAGIHFRAAQPFADVITTPQCLRDDYGARHRRYPGFKALAYLHPNRFVPNSRVREELGLQPTDPLFLLRFSALKAAHDHSAVGLTPQVKQELIRLLSQHGHLIVSDEQGLSPERERYASILPADRFHDLLAAADLCIGDSLSVAAEAAVLGTYALRLSSFSGQVDYLRVLEDEYHLIQNFHPGQEHELLHQVRRFVSDLPRLRSEVAGRRVRLLRDCVDVTTWYRNLVYELVAE